MPPIGGWKTGVYALRNKISGKVYVGSAALAFRVRFEYHRRRLIAGIHENTYLQAAWNKYGSERFEFVILERCKPELCLTNEQRWMDFYRSYERNKGYNICPKAGSVLGTKWTDERRAAGFSPETRAKMSAARKGKKLSPESVRKRTLKQTGIKRSEETRKRMSWAAKNRKKVNCGTQGTT